jgi:hypothetical protein
MSVAGCACEVIIGQHMQVTAPLPMSHTLCSYELFNGYTCLQLQAGGFITSITAARNSLVLWQLCHGDLRQYRQRAVAITQHRVPCNLI